MAGSVGHARRKAPVKRKKGTGTLRVYEEIRERILSLALKPGANLQESELVQQLGFSRTPVREALIRLGAEGLVEVLPNRSARVSAIDLSRVNEFFEMFDVEQRAVTRWAALRREPTDLEFIDSKRLAFEKAVEEDNVESMSVANTDFHMAIAGACGNHFAAQQYDALLVWALRLSRLSLIYEGGRDLKKSEHLNRIVREHRAFVKHLKSGNADGAEEIARVHTETFRNRVLSYIGHNLAPDIRL
jgi:DNA-binding GntR family transcriptional regulator